MFQNINNNEVEDTIVEEIDTNNKKSKQEKILNVIQRMFTKQNIVLYMIAFMISTVGFGTELAPFAIAILASCLSSNIPVRNCIHLYLHRYSNWLWRTSLIMVFID